MTKQLFCGLAVAAVVMATQALAPVSAALVTPISVANDTTANSDTGLGRFVSNLIDSNNATNWVTVAVVPDYFANGGPDPVLTFGLGGTYDLTDLVLTPYPISGNRISVVDVSFSTTGTSGPFSGGVTLTPVNGSATETLSLGGTFAANAVQLTVTDNYSDNRVGATEVKFEGTLVPEPSTFALTAFALLGLLACGRRRRR